MIAKFLVPFAAVGLAAAPATASRTNDDARMSAPKQICGGATVTKNEFVGGGTVLLGAFAVAGLFVIYHTLLTGSGDGDDVPDSN